MSDDSRAIMSAIFRNAMFLNYLEFERYSELDERNRIITRWAWISLLV